jgi:anti-sigma regulatory factor (Ser/Thr protein kinase)
MVLCSEFSICGEADVALARHSAGEKAMQLGFADQRRAEVRLIASELAHNHLDHKTSGGMLRISGQLIDQVPVLTICSLDTGPGICNVSEVLQGPQGGYHSLTGLGTGLASASRLADRFSSCSGADPRSSCSEGGQGKGTLLAARCWPRKQMPPFFAADGMDVAALVCGRSETSPCGDGIFISSDSRFSRIVIVDSPGKGRGGGETDLIGRMLAKLDLIWPPDHVLESLSGVFAAEPATAVSVLRFDRLLSELRCCKIGNIGVHLLIDDMPVAPPLSTAVEGGQLIQGPDTVYKVAGNAACLMHSDGISRLDRQQITPLLLELQAADREAAAQPRLDAVLLTQMLFSRYRQATDDAALCVWSWQGI